MIFIEELNYKETLDDLINLIEFLLNSSVNNSSIKKIHYDKIEYNLESIKKMVLERRNLFFLHEVGVVLNDIVEKSLSVGNEIKKISINFQLGEYFKKIALILNKYNHLESLEIEQDVIYHYLSQPALYKIKNKSIAYLYFSLSFCLSMYENFNSEPLKANFEEDYTLEKNKILFERYILPLYKSLQCQII